jgi:hypothetical protein
MSTESAWRHLIVALIIATALSHADAFSNCPCVDQCLYAVNHFASLSDSDRLFVKLIKYGKYSCSIALLAPTTCPYWENVYLQGAIKGGSECIVPGACQWPVTQNSTKRTCICDPKTSKCVPNSVISGLLTTTQATYLGLLICGLPALAIAALVTHELWKGRAPAFGVFYALVCEALNLGSTIVYFFSSQYANTLLFGLSAGFIGAPLLVYFYHCTFTLKENALYKTFSYDVALKDQCDSLGNYLKGQWNFIVSICVTLIGTLLWKAEVLIVPGVFKFWTGEHVAPSEAVPLFSAELYHKRMLSTLLLDSAPSLAIQVYNNIVLASYGMFGWDVIAIVSAAFSGLSIVNALYGSVYKPIRKHGLNFSQWEMPEFNPIKAAMSAVSFGRKGDNVDPHEAHEPCPAEIHVNPLAQHTSPVDAAYRVVEMTLNQAQNPPHNPPPTPNPMQPPLPEPATENKRADAGGRGTSRTIPDTVTYGKPQFRVSAQENGVYSAWFRAAASSFYSTESGKLTPQDARDFLQRSGLPAPTLSHVWQATEARGSLSYQQFVIACRLIALIQNGTAERMTPEEGHAAILNPLQDFPQMQGV